MYEPILLIHSWTRWIVLIGLVSLLIQSFRGWVKQTEWTEGHSTLLWGVDQIFGYQVLFGLFIWLALSPFTKAGFANPRDILDQPLIFFWTLRHALTMLLALVLFQAAKFRARKIESSRGKFKWLTFATAVVLLVIFSAIPWAIPWPGLEYGRDLFRWPQ